MEELYNFGREDERLCVSQPALEAEDQQPQVAVQQVKREEGQLAPTTGHRPAPQTHQPLGKFFLSPLPARNHPQGHLFQDETQPGQQEPTRQRGPPWHLEAGQTQLFIKRVLQVQEGPDSGGLGQQARPALEHQGDPPSDLKIAEIDRLEERQHEGDGGLVHLFTKTVIYNPTKPHQILHHQKIEPGRTAELRLQLSHEQGEGEGGIAAL